MAMTEPPSSSSSADEQQQQYLSSTSSTVSQSPIQEGTDHSCSNDNNSDAATTTLQQQRNNNNNNSSTVIINPYKKQAPTPSSIHNQDPKVHRRRQFIEKYRLQSLHNNNHHHRQGGGEMIASRSALEVLRLHQQWRQQWRRRSEYQPQQQSRDDSCTNDNRRSYSKKQFALRPRLFLFQRMMQPRRMESNSMTSQHDQQQHQQQGVWELGTGITELSGEGGSGKTQICLSLCMTCALTPLLFSENHDNSNNNNNNASSSMHPTTQSNSNDGNNYTSIYITMGEGIPQSKVATRLHQMLHHRVPNIHNNNNNSNQDDDHDDEVERILSRIWLLSLKNEDDFIEFVEIHLPNILNNQSCGIKPQQQQQQQTPNNQYPTCHKVGFIAFDGIANFFRFSDPLFQQHSQSNNYNQKSMFHQHRSSKLFQISSLLRKMSDVYDVPIVITNQVTSSIPSDDGLLLKRPSDDMSCMMGGVGQNNKIQPALGLIWSNCVTTRFMQRVRKASVLQSVCTPEESEVWYFIDAGAVVAVSRAHRSDDR